MSHYKRLKTMTDCRRFASDLIRRVDRGEVDLQRADTMNRVLKSVIRTVEGSEIEARLELLEAKIDEQD